MYCELGYGLELAIACNAMKAIKSIAASTGLGSAAPLVQTCYGE